MTGKTYMAKRAAQQETSEGEPDDAPTTHPEEIRTWDGIDDRWKTDDACLDPHDPTRGDVREPCRGRHHPFDRCICPDDGVVRKLRIFYASVRRILQPLRP